jgi:DNA-binding NarL/FixJ family response regulator
MRPMTSALKHLEGKALSPRERELCSLVAKGLANKEIAAELHLTKQTVAQYVSNCMAKVSARNRAHLAVLTTPRAVDQPRATMRSTR